MAHATGFLNIHWPAALWLLIALSPLGSWLESDISRHMLLELPLLALLGALYRPPRRMLYRPLVRQDPHGWSALALATCIFIYWLLPISLDASLSSPAQAWLKYTTLPVFGLCLRYGLGKAGFILKGVLAVELLAVVFRMGWLYLESPIRLCSNYSLDQQTQLGRQLLVIGIVMTAAFILRGFSGRRLSLSR